MSEEIEVEGVKVDFQACDHCRQEPTRKDVVAAVRRSQEERKRPRWCCAYCGKSIKATKYSVRHDGGIWSACEAETEPVVSINQMHVSNAPPIYDHNSLHLGCVLKSMPYINGYERE